MMATHDTIRGWVRETLQRHRARANGDRAVFDALVEESAKVAALLGDDFRAAETRRQAARMNLGALP